MSWALHLAPDVLPTFRRLNVEHQEAVIDRLEQLCETPEQVRYSDKNIAYDLVEIHRESQLTIYVLILGVDDGGEIISLAGLRWAVND